jgi:glycine/D-amino acid oxidase-like deaminating enzyme
MKIGEPGFWIDSLGGPPALRPPLPGSLQVDVAIVGGGFTGLWTAYYLKRADPGLRVAVLEAGFAGQGASGRNGGWVSGFFSGPRRAYSGRGGRGGREGVVALQRAMFDTVDEIGAVLERERIDADWVKGGVLTVALNRAQEERLRSRQSFERSWGFGEEDFRLLAVGELAHRVCVAGARLGGFSPHAARVHPAKLVLGLAAAVERLGVTIYEDTPVAAVGDRVAVTARGEVRAEWIVRATEGYTARLRAARRDLVPMNSSMIMTAPLPDAALQAIRWEGREVLGDAAHVYAYLQCTADGRITIGGRGRPYRYGSDTAHVGAIPETTIASLRALLDRMFPTTAGVEITHAWSGVLGVPRDWCVSAAADPARGYAWAGGYVGEGVAMTNLAGRTLADLIRGEGSELTRLPWVGRTPGRWEPEPLRWLGIHGVYALYRTADRIEARTGRPSRLGAFVDRFSGRE